MMIGVVEFFLKSLTYLQKLNGKPDNMNCDMSNLFHTVTELNKSTLNKPSDSDMVYYSELNTWHTGNAFRSFSLKYVVERRIYYRVGNKEHIVDAGHFLLGCKQPGVSAYFESKEPVKSICIDICPSTVAEATAILSGGDQPSLDNFMAGYFKAPHFFETVSDSRNAAFGKRLYGLVQAIQQGVAPSFIDREWLLDLLEEIIIQEKGHHLALLGLRSLKWETRVEILRRLKVGKAFMDEEFLNISQVAQVAKVSNMSEFHFFRSFRQAFGISPYQYLLGKRLDLSRGFLLAGGRSVTDIATHCNFPDLFTFSKAFKRRFHISPSQLLPGRDTFIKRS